MKRITTFILVCIASLTTWMGTMAQAQNPVFEKYADIENLEYVCITNAMLRNLGKSSATINGIRIDGITESLKNVLIINSSDEEVIKTMKADFAKIRKEKGYELMMEMRDGSDRISTIAQVGKENSELILFIQEGNNETSFVVLNGKFSENQLRQLLSNAGK